MIGVASPLRFRVSPEEWTLDRVRSALYEDLDRNLGATMQPPWYREPSSFEARRFDMDNGDVALFCWNREVGYWIGNTETPSTLWRTDKVGFDGVPQPVREWAERELLAQLHEESPWLADYPALSSFFLPVFLSKDGRHSSRTFFAEHAGGFPEVDTDEALDFYEALCAAGLFGDARHEMAAKLGTSEQLDLTRMRATMGEFNAASLLDRSGYTLQPEIEVSSGHVIDYRIDPGGHLVEVTRPTPPRDRTADSPIRALKETAATKTDGQLAVHGGGIILFVDCSSFTEADWTRLEQQRPDIGHRPAVMFWMRPDGSVDWYTRGNVPFELAPT